MSVRSRSPAQRSERPRAASPWVPLLVYVAGLWHLWTQTLPRGQDGWERLVAGAIPRVAALVWLQAVVLAAGWACASLAAVTGLLVVARLGHPEARLWCVPLPLVCLGVGGLGAVLPLVHPPWLGARLGLRPARQERRLPRLPDDPVTGL